MQIVLVSSPGLGKEPHWSHAAAAEMAALALARGASVRWLAALHPGQPSPADKLAGREDVDRTRLELSLHHSHRVLPDTAVADSQHDSELDLALTQHLREQPLAAVVHVGVGGRGTPNALWLSDRLGSATFAVLDGDELVCQRTDLVDRDGKPCTQWDDPERCRWCCATRLLGRPSSNDFRNRIDLLVAGLQTCAFVAVSSESQAGPVIELGVAKARVLVASGPDLLLDRVLAVGASPATN